MASRYSTHGSLEATYQPGSRGRVLANRLGMTRVRDIQQAESEVLVSLADALVVELADSHRFTEADLCDFHCRWLGDIYTWAGSYRQVNMTKGGFQFAAAHLVPG